jgi:O-antigen ligase
MVATLVLTPVLLVADIWDTSQLRPIRDRPALALAAVVLGVAFVLAAGWWLSRRPGWFPLIAVALVPFRIPIESGGQTANLLAPLYVAIAAGAAAYAITVLRGEAEHRTRPRALEWVLAASLVLYGVQAAYTSEPQKALEQMVFFYAPFAVLYGLLTQVQWTRQLALRCLGVLVGLALLFVGVGFVEYATRHVLLNPRVVASNQFESYFRVNSLFFDPSIYGRFLVVVMLALVSVLLWVRDRRTTLATAALLAVLWAGLVLTLSQSSFAALLVGMGVLLGLKWDPRRAAYAAGALLAVGVAIVVLFSTALNVEVNDGKTLSDSTSGRTELLEGGYDLWKGRPLQGWGSASYVKEFREQQHVPAQRALSASHTIPVTVAAEQGLIGLALYLALLALTFLRLLPGASRGPVRAAFAAIMAALIFHTLLYAAFLEDPLFWTVLGLGTAAVAADAPRRRTRRQPAGEAQPASPPAASRS